MTVDPRRLLPKAALRLITTTLLPAPADDRRALADNFYQVSYIEVTLSIMSFIYFSLLPLNPDQALTWFFPKLFSL
ncbi:hypothetical protein Y697_06390 [Mesotoga sp. BH458_6_3_2_1]|nr:hypothetical protein Y697_06390 [Mesotoga sp. BH458_6_3_2_1]